MGEPDVAGVIFLCNADTHSECIRRKLFGVNAGYIQTVRYLQMGTPVFLYNTTKHQITAGFVTMGMGAKNIVPEAWENIKNQEQHRRRIAQSSGFGYRSRYGQWHEDDSIFSAQVKIEQVEVFPPLPASAVKSMLRGKVDRRTNRLLTLELDLDERNELLEMFMDEKEDVWKKRPTSFFTRYLEEDEDSDDAASDVSPIGISDKPPDISRAQAAQWVNYLTKPPPRNITEGECIICYSSLTEVAMCHRSPCKECDPLCCAYCQGNWLITKGTCIICHAKLAREPPAVTPLAATLASLDIDEDEDATPAVTPPATPAMTPLAANLAGCGLTSEDEDVLVDYEGTPEL